MTDGDRKVFRAMGVYAVVGLLVFGWRYNHTPDCSDRPAYESISCNDRRELGSAAAGALWPVYIGGRIALYVTRWP